MNDTSVGAEIRVHGIGNHDELSALGSPPTIKTTAPNVVVANPPSIPPHRLELVNWSRTTRKTTGLLWNLAFPFTLLNVASYMGPARPPSERNESERESGLHGGFRFRRSRSLGLAIHVVGAVLTIQSTAWLIAIGETLFRKVPLSPSWWPAERTSALIAGGSAGIIIVAILGRQLVRTESRVGWTLATLHIALAGGFSFFCWTVRPAQLDWQSWPSTVMPLLPIDEVIRRSLSGEGYPVAVHLDALTLVIVGGLAICGVVSAALVALSARSRARSLAGAAILIASSVVLLNAGASFVRIGFDWLTVYFLERYASRPGTLGPADRILMPFDDPVLGTDFRPDLIPFTAVLCAASLVVAVVIVSFFRQGPPTMGFREFATVAPVLKRAWSTNDRSVSKKIRQEWVHQMVVRAGRSLPIVVSITIVVAIGIGTLIYLRRATILTGGSWVLLLAGLHLTLIIVFAFLLTKQPANIANATALIADIAGFWRVEAHPLGGVSYTPSALEGIDDAFERNSELSDVVLVGHSQGSVICAWYISRKLPRASDTPRVHLITCGSPLDSLYATFFPGIFDAEFFATVQTRATSWVNHWRLTDPIATNLTELSESDNRRLGEEIGELWPGPVERGHSNYWLEEAQKTAVGDRVAGRVRRPGTGASPG